MSNVQRNGKTLPAQVRKLAPGQELAAIAAAKSNGADDVFFKVGDDNFVASGRGLSVGKVNDVISLDGKAGRVVAVDRQLNTFWEGLRHPAGLIVGGAGAAWGIAGFVQGVLQGANMAGIGLIIAAAAVVVGVGINLVPAAYGAFRGVDTAK